MGGMRGSQKKGQREGKRGEIQVSEYALVTERERSEIN